MIVTAYTIAKDEEFNVAQWYETTEGADYRVIVDTGSTDETVKVAKELGIIVYQIHLHHFTFDLARNIALSLCPKSDWYVSLDMDERLSKGWRDSLEAIDTNVEVGIDAINVKLVCPVGPDGISSMSYPAKRIHLGRCRWTYPVHEVIESSKDYYTESIVITHHQAYKPSRSRYLRIMEDWLKDVKETDKPRLYFYIAREYKYEKDHWRAAHYFEEYLRISTWKEERCAALIALGDMCVLPAKAEGYYLKAAGECASMREPWIRLAELKLSQGNAIEATMYAQRALTISERSTTYISEAWAWNGTAEAIIEAGVKMITDQAQKLEQEATNG